MVGVLLFLSASLALIPAVIAARRFSPSPDDRFWIAAALAGIQPGLIANLLSPFHALTPTAWLATQAVLAAAIFLAARTRPPLPAAPVRFRFEWIPLAAILSLSAALLWLTPIFQGDEKMYHASRVLYWIQNRSVFPYLTHNDRQVVFSYQAELFFLWPVLLTRLESAGRMVFWLAVPLSAVGFHLLLLRAAVSRALAAALTALFLATPLVFAASASVKPEMWNVLWTLGAAYWLLRALEDRPGAARHVFFAGVFLALAVNTKFSALALFPALFLAGRAKSLLAGFVSAAVLSGLAILFGFNALHYSNPLGPTRLRHVVAADLSPHQIRVHLARSALLLLEPPGLPNGFAATLEQPAATLARLTGAADPLPLESPHVQWPGAYRFQVTDRARRFSTGGLLALFAILAAPLTFRRLNSVSALTALGVSSFLAIALLTRWMLDSQVPERFLLPSFALLLAAFAARCGPWFRGWRLAALLAVLTVSVLLSASEMAASCRFRAGQPIPQMTIASPYAEALSVLPPSARILFFGGQDSPDYALFGASANYSHYVQPYGKDAFHPEFALDLIRRNHLSHVLVTVESVGHHRVLDFHWNPDRPTTPILDWFAAQPAFQDIPLDGAQRLFWYRPSGLPSQTDPALRFQQDGLPAGAPLVTVAPNLRSTVGLAPAFSDSGYPVEMLPAPEFAFRWIGAGDAEGVGFALRAASPSDLSLDLDVSPGPGRHDTLRHLRVTVDAVDAAPPIPFDRSGTLHVPIRLGAGVHSILVSCDDSPEAIRHPNGDSRHLLIGLHEIRLSPR